MEPRRNTTLFQEIGETPTVDIYYYEWTGPGNEKKSNADAMADVERRELIDDDDGFQHTSAVSTHFNFTVCPASAIPMVDFRDQSVRRT